MSSFSPLIGDKKSTAVHISYACGHFNKSMLLHELVDTADLNGRKICSLVETVEHFSPGLFSGALSILNIRTGPEVGRDQ